MADSTRTSAPWWRARLTLTWRWIVGLAWAAVCAGFGAVVDLGDYLGKLPAWWDWRLAVAVLPVATIVLTVLGARAILALSAASTVLVGALAVVDLVAERPGAAAVEAILAVAALLVTVAAVGGRADEPPELPLPPPRDGDLVATTLDPA
jgi:hypothetical protein